MTIQNTLAASETAEARIVKDNTDIVVFSAGSGNRLGLDVPKCLAPIGDRPLLFWQVRVLRRSYPDSRIVVVIGSQHQRVRALFDDLLREHADHVELVFNPFHDCSGIMGSAWFSLPSCTKDRVLRLDGDLLFTSSSPIVNYTGDCPALFTFEETESVENPTPVVEEAGIRLVSGYTGKDAWRCAEVYRREEYLEIVEGALDLIKKGHYFEAINRWQGRGSLKKVEVGECVEIDTIDDYRKAQSFWRTRNE
jgi:choline kinase